MEPKEKAQQLIDYFSANVEKETINGYSEELELSNAKDCALICVEEIQRALHIWDIGYERNGYWDEVKQYIYEKL